MEQTGIIHARLSVDDTAVRKVGHKGQWEGQVAMPSARCSLDLVLSFQASTFHYLLSTRKGFIFIHQSILPHLFSSPEFFVSLKT